jgi:DnaK suppressor protein
VKTSKKPVAKAAKAPTPAKAKKAAAVAKKPAIAKVKTAPVKPVVKAKVKAPAKTQVVGTLVKASAKVVPKVLAKEGAKSAIAKMLDKPAAKVAKKAAVAPKGAAVKTKSAVSAASPAVVVATKSSPAVKVVSVPSSPLKKAAKASQVKSMSVTKVESAKTPAPAPSVASPDQLVRATRPSARLAQITVPSLPPAVASTAAKASFLPSAPAPVSVPFAPVKKDAKLANNWKNKKLEDLTDAEVLAMSDDEYMNDVQMAYFRRKLVLLKQEILNSAGETTEHLREDTVVVPDPADRATIEEEHALELRTRDRERKLLKKIEQSIIRIDAGDYGFCDETGEAIGVGRLLARPTATLSLEAQQRRELKQKMFGD